MPIARDRAISLSVVAGVQRILDLLIVGATGIAAGIAVDFEGAMLYQMTEVIAVLACAIVFHINGIYRFDSLNFRSMRDQMTRLVVSWTVVVLGLIVAGFFLKVSSFVSRVWIVMWYVGAMAGVGTVRGFLVVRSRHWVAQGRLTRRVVLVGGSDIAAMLIDRVASSTGIHVVGFFDDRSDRAPDRIGSVPRMGTLKDLIEYAQSHRVDDVVITLPLAATKRIIQIGEQLKALPLTISVVPDRLGVMMVHTSFGTLSGVPLLGIARRPLSDWQHVAKEFEDRVLAGALMVPISLVMLVVAVLIKLDSRGPVFFRQARLGFNNRVINVWKFRTMYADQCDVYGDRLTDRRDPRVTRIGWLLRRTSIDEIPQILNVLNGEMSLVGPRPHPLKAKANGRFYHEVVSEYACRHRVKPGITGWAQVNGWRGNTDTEEKIKKRVECDLYYIENWSMALDLKILFMTVFALLKKDENAY